MGKGSYLTPNPLFPLQGILAPAGDGRLRNLRVLSKPTLLSLDLRRVGAGWVGFGYVWRWNGSSGSPLFGSRGSSGEWGAVTGRHWTGLTC